MVTTLHTEARDTICLGTLEPEGLRVEFWRGGAGPELAGQDQRIADLEVEQHPWAST